ncbi:acyltransferase family protein [Pedobacter arcticus]|uniref:acyltransferase family protein n=1 Tax=Pedobacter arcticus TaxID=752140 RepID=UPI00037A48C1|nr:heparan-alpha-glucosaminide N-acetyltransferase domain-containing protein [Pedobacter arcticus]
MQQTIPKQRLLSLDFFRGLTVAAMILVNNSGDWSHIYAPFEHASWEGCTPTDLIFPFFLFIVGVSIVFALDSAKQDSENHGKLLKSIFRRSITLFLLGMILALYPVFNFAEVRIPGVLQRIAVVYLVCSILFVKVNHRTLFRLFLGFILVYWLLMAFIPVPGVGAANFNKGTNLAAYIDGIVFKNHMWSVTKTWDPEGFLSTFPSFSTGLFGVLMGIILKSKYRTQENKVIWLFTYGFLAVVLGLFWDLFFPINKALWTSSFVLYTGGIASMTLALCYWLIDVQGFTKFTKPFVIYGVNAITVYFASSVIAKTLNLIKISIASGTEVSAKNYIYEMFYTPYMSPYNASLGYAATFVLIWFFILWFMYKRNIIIKV